MDILMETLTELLNGIIPSGSTFSVQLASLNELLAYGITLGVLYSFLLKPILRLFKLGGK